MSRKDKSQIQLPGSPYGMDLKPRDISATKLKFSDDDFSGVYEYHTYIGDLNDMVDDIESGEGHEGLADAWGVCNPSVIAKQEQSDEVERLTKEFLEKGGEITSLKDEDRGGVFDGWH